jgi:hypothetical protein
MKFLLRILRHTQDGQFCLCCISIKNDFFFGILSDSESSRRDLSRELENQNICDKSSNVTPESTNYVGQVFLSLAVSQATCINRAAACVVSTHTVFVTIVVVCILL